MAEVPVMINCLVYPRNKTVAPFPATIVGSMWNPTLEIGGGPIIDPPPDIKPEPPLIIWGGPIDPYPDIGFPVPQPPINLPPIDPPPQVEPPHEGWNWSAAKSGWYYLYVPGPTDAQPKRKR